MDWTQQMCRLQLWGIIYKCVGLQTERTKRKLAASDRSNVIEKDHGFIRLPLINATSWILFTFVCHWMSKVSAVWRNVDVLYTNRIKQDSSIMKLTVTGVQETMATISSRSERFERSTNATCSAVGSRYTRWRRQEMPVTCFVIT